MLTPPEHLGSPTVVGGVRVVHHFNFCVVFLCLLVFVLFLVPPMLPVSLDCPLLITPSVFSHVYCLYGVRVDVCSS